MQRWRHPAPDPDEPNHGSDDPGADARTPASKPEPFGPGAVGHAETLVDPRQDGHRPNVPVPPAPAPAAVEADADSGSVPGYSSPIDGADAHTAPDPADAAPDADRPDDQTDGRSDGQHPDDEAAGGAPPQRAERAPGARTPAGAHEQTVVANPADHLLERATLEGRDAGDDAATVVAAGDHGDDLPTAVVPSDDAEAPTAVADAAGADAAGGESDEDEDEDVDEAAPSASSGLKHILFGILGMVVLIVAIRLLAPHVGFLDDTWQKVRKGDPVWLVLCVVLEVFSFAGYVWVFNATAVRSGLRLPRVTTWRITLAGVAATRLIATAGAGGIAATTFALRRHGLDSRAAAATVTAQLAIVYGWFIFLIMLTGLALFVGGHGHAAITIVPAAIAAGILLTAAGGRSVIRKLATVSAQREGRVAEAVAVIPGTLDDAVATVVTLVRERDSAIVGGALWWLADAGVLWAACHAFGASPNVLDVTMAYLLGQTANLLPIPGGLGVEAGLLGMLIAFGVPGGVAVLASLVQRLISTWLPALPGALALASIGHASPDAEVVPVDDDPPPPGAAATAA